MKTYSVLYAQDVPHYGTSEIEAENDDEAIEKAKAISEDDLTSLTLDPAWDSTICSRIVHIEAPDGNLIAGDVPLDAYTLIYGADKRLLYEYASRLADALGQAIDALERIREITHYEDGEPVTGLESHEIAAIYADAAGQIDDFRATLKNARGLA